MRYTLAPAVFRLLALALQIHRHEGVQLKVYKKIFELARTLTEKVSALNPVLGIKLYL